MFGRDVSKSSQRVRAYGAVDDFSATLGLARSFAGKELGAEILGIQESLVCLMTELATKKEDFHLLTEKKLRLLGDGDLKSLEDRIESAERYGDIFSGWTHSGETHLQAALDMARARCRNAEREIVGLAESEGLARAALCCDINGETRDLTTPLHEGDRLSILTFQDEMGRWALHVSVISMVSMS